MSLTVILGKRAAEVAEYIVHGSANPPKNTTGDDYILMTPLPVIDVDQKRREYLSGVTGLSIGYLEEHASSPDVMKVMSEHKADRDWVTMSIADIGRDSYILIGVYDELDLDAVVRSRIKYEVVKVITDDEDDVFPDVEADLDVYL